MPRSSPTLQVVRPSAKASKPRASADAGTSTQRIVESITAAIVERRLMPGTKLAEQKIADIFKVSRTLVRQALNQLSRDKLVTLEPARGARVAEPSIEEARQVFEVRRLLEAAMIRRAATDLSDAQLAELRTHLRGALNNGVSREEIREVFLQVAIYAGVPAAVDSFRIAREVFDEIDTP